MNISRVLAAGNTVALFGPAPRHNMTLVVGARRSARRRAPSPIRTGGAFDYWGAGLLSIAPTALLLALTKGNQWGWASPGTLLCVLIGAVVLAGWIPVELRVRRPLVDLRIASRPAAQLVNIASVSLGSGCS